MDTSCIKELFRDSSELLIVADENKSIIYLNQAAKQLFEGSLDLKNYEHLFSFNICILDKSNILEYSPLSEALSSKIPTRSEVLFQSGENQYQNFYLRSFKNNEKTVIILSDYSDKKKLIENQTQLNEAKEQVLRLEKDNREFSELRGKAQNLAVRTGLINRISSSIRESLEIDKIIDRALEGISKTLGCDKSFFAEFYPEKNFFALKNSWNLKQEEIDKFSTIQIYQDYGINQAVNNRNSSISMIITDPISGIVQPRLVTPVIYKNKILGILVLYHKNSTRHWHEEEISLIEGITSQLASAVNQAELFETVAKQKDDLEKAIIELKETQTRLIQSEKMASLGQLVAGVAHEINTPLGSMNSSNSIFSKCIEKIINHKGGISELEDILEILKETLATNSEAIRRIDKLVKSLKNFARLDQAEYQEADIHEGIKSTLMLINHELKNKIKIVQNFGNLPHLKCFPNQLNQVFMNILVNACQSIEKEGIIKINTGQKDGHAVITISDNGKGISKDNITRIFDPGFTTKGVGVGTGLGLSICYQIIEKHKGKILVESEPGKGTSFIIELPL